MLKTVTPIQIHIKGNNLYRLIFSEIIQLKSFNTIYVQTPFLVVLFPSITFFSLLLSSSSPISHHHYMYTTTAGSRNQYLLFSLIFSLEYNNIFYINARMDFLYQAETILHPTRATVLNIYYDVYYISSIIDIIIDIIV